MPARLRPRPMLVAALLASFPLVPAHAQLDPLDPYGLKPKPPPEPAKPTPPPAAKPAAAPDAGTAPAAPLSLKDIDKQIQQYEQKTGLAPPPEEDPYKNLGNGVPTDRLGATLPTIQSFQVKDVLKDVAIFEGEQLLVEGVVRRSCNSGCWVEVAEYKSAPEGIRIIPSEGWKFFYSDRDRRVKAYGKLKKRRLTQKQARALDTEASEKPKSSARTEWVLEAEGAEVQWLY